MHIFYSSSYKGNIFSLDESESFHLERVLRLNPGDAATVIDGSGSLYHCKVIDTNKKEAKLEVCEVIENYGKRDYYLHIAIAPTKNIDRFEWFIEKSVEMGIDRITPLICKRSERRITKTARSKRIIISAMKQSVKAKETIIDDPLPFDKFVYEISEPNRFISHCNKGSLPALFSDLIGPGDNGLVLIGPEGDFSPEELSTALDNGFKELSLGESRLRTETAGLVACSMFYFINQ
jgi:16S rRNA (uracil1498-N3)-methyltransferase